MNIKIILSYDGTNFLGWQKSDKGPTIEAHLKDNLEKIYQEPIDLIAASRTDCGVHAEGQVVNYISQKKKDLFKLKISLNKMLPKEIRVISIDRETDSFHATLDAIGKEYNYFLTTDEVQSPFERNFYWHFRSNLNINDMIEASYFFTGTHNFSSLSNSTSSNITNPICTIDLIKITKNINNYRIKIDGNRFLYKMVRNIVGTLVYIGSGKLPISMAKTIILTRDRTLAGITAPAHGLLLKQVFYKKPPL